MDKDQVNRRQLTGFIFYWSLLNLLFYALGIGIDAIISEYGYLHSFLSFLEDLLIPLLQSFLFAISLLITYSLTRRKWISSYSFAIIQNIVLHLIFLSGLEKEEGLRFIGASDIIGLDYLLIYSQSYLIWIINNIKPIEGDFDHGHVIPNSTIYFYFLQVFMPSVYYYLITFLTDKIINRQPTLNTDDNPGTAAQTST